MKFSTKVFFAIFGVTTVLGSALNYTAQKILTRRAEGEFIVRYRTLTDVVAKSLVETEKKTSALMRAAAEVVSLKMGSKQSLPRTDLVELAAQLDVTHFFIINSAGKFVASTNEPPEQIPNLFSFCDKYESLIKPGGPAFVATPIVPAYPEPKPHKFLVVPNAGRTALIEVGVRADFINQTVADILKQDKNLNSFSLLTPDGTSLGEYRASGIKFGLPKASLPEDLSRIDKVTDGYRIFTRVQAPHGAGYDCEINPSLRENYYYITETSVSNRELATTIRTLRTVFWIMQIALLFVAAIAARFFSGKLSERVSSLMDQLGGINQLKPGRQRVGISGKDEISFLSKTIDQLLDRLESAQSQLVSSQKREIENQVLAQLTSQVAHDIRSPLSALSSLEKDLGALDEDKRVMLRSAVNRIKDIANNLLDKNREISSTAKGSKALAESTNEATSIQLLSSLIEPLISEKRLQFRSKIGIEIDSQLGVTSYGLFSCIQVTEFKRVISNLINNAVEELGEKGRVALKIERVSDHIEIRVTDNGRGIPPEILVRLGQKGETHGKDGGSGLGLYHAKSRVESWGGTLRIDSQVGKGTSVVISLPRVQAPHWFVSEVKLSPGERVIVLDDDASIHNIWADRFDSEAVNDVRLLHFSTPNDFSSFVDTDASAKAAQYLMDFELLGFEETGLSLIEKHGLGGRAILVTSRFDEERIQNACMRLGVKLIPKAMAGFVPISVAKPRTKYDAILLDDDELVHMTWKGKTKENNKSLLCFSEPKSLLAELTDIDTDTPVYIDSNLGNGVKGQDLVPKLASLGFKKICLVTGYEADSFGSMPGLTAVVGKDPALEICS